MAPFLRVIVGLIVVGVLIWVAETMLPLDGVIVRLIEVVAVVGVLLFLLRDVGGIWGSREV
jgi:hypothetical protein